MILALAFMPGCRTLNLTNPNRVDSPGSAQKRLSPMATEMVQKWSDNASKIKSGHMMGDLRIVHFFMGW